MTETTVVSADGTPLAARHSGSGSALVLVHGALGDLNTFALLEEPLARHHTVWVYSRRNRGGSGEGSSYGVEREVEDVSAVLDAAGGDAHLFGHSSGAFYAMLAAPRAARLRSLLLYEPPLHIENVDRNLRDRMTSALADGDPAHAIETFAPVADIAPEELAAVRSQEMVWQALEAGVQVFPRELQALQDEGPDLLSQAQLPDVPLLYLYGELTRAPVYAPVSEVAERYPEAHLHCLSRQRHLAPMFDAEAFAQAILEFTARVDGEPAAGEGR
ncbi:MAG: alpha/beta fold hydrolase [Pseudomonadota bacterium]